MPILKIPLPGNLIYFLNIIQPIVAFDILDWTEGEAYDPTNIFNFDSKENTLDK